jgi:hypothetical protein
MPAGVKRLVVLGRVVSSVMPRREPLHPASFELEINVQDTLLAQQSQLRNPPVQCNPRARLKRPPTPR